MGSVLGVEAFHLGYFLNGSSRAEVELESDECVEKLERGTRPSAILKAFSESTTIDDIIILTALIVFPFVYGSQRAAIFGANLVADTALAIYHLASSIFFALTLNPNQSFKHLKNTLTFIKLGGHDICNVCKGLTLMIPILGCKVIYYYHLLFSRLSYEKVESEDQLVSMILDRLTAVSIDTPYCSGSFAENFNWNEASLKIIDLKKNIKNGVPVKEWRLHFRDWKFIHFIFFRSSPIEISLYCDFSKNSPSCFFSKDSPSGCSPPRTSNKIPVTEENFLKLLKTLVSKAEELHLEIR